MSRGGHKKLIAWARWQCGVSSGYRPRPDAPTEKLWSPDITVEYCIDCRKAGGCAAVGKQCPEPRLLPEAQLGVAAFLKVHTQWNVGGLGQRTGLRYESVIATLERALPVWQADDPAAWADRTVADLLDDVQIIETAMLSADDERRQAERDAPPQVPR